jgi:ATP-binding cassette subfamily B protein
MPVGTSSAPSSIGLGPKVHLARRIYWSFAPYLKPYWRQMMLAYASLIGAVVMSVLGPWPLKLIFDHILGNKALPGVLGFVTVVFGRDRSTLLVLFCVAMVVLVLLGAIFSYINRYLLSKIGQSVTNDIRLGIFEHLQTLSVGSVGSKRTGDLVFRLTTDIKCVRDLLVGYVQDLGRDLLSVLTTLAVVLWMDWRLTLVSLTVVPPLLAVSHYFSTQIQSATMKRQRKESEVASIVQETMTSIAVVQAFTQEKRERKRLKKESSESLEAALEGTRFSRAFGQVVKILNTCGTALVVWYGVSRVLGGRLTPGDIIVFVAYVKNLYDPVNSLSDFAVGFAESLVSGERLLELLEADAEIQDAPDAVKAPAFKGEVCFQNVTFGYRLGEPVLKDLSFQVKAGQTAALVGYSGAGKSTILKLLLRFCDPWKGRISVDGQEIRGLQIKSLRRQISIVPQDPILFRRTIGENIAYGKPDATRQEIVAAAEAAQAHQFITSLPEGYETLLDERGGNLSGGQKQRIALARAFLTNAPILILDEPATGLDSVTESQLNETVSRLTQEKTTFVIAHRLSTIRRADLILLIDQGKIAERGTHTELLARSGPYRRLYELQYRHAGPPEHAPSPAVRTPVTASH